MTLKNYRTPLLCYFKFCTSFCSHWSIKTGVTVWKRSMCDLELWHMTLKNNRAPLLRYFNICALFRSHRSIQTGVTVRKRFSWVLTFVTLTFDLWPCHFVWTSLLSMLITTEIFMMIQWWEHSEKGVTDRQTDRQTDRHRQTGGTIHRTAIGGDFKLELQSGNAQFVSKSTIFLSCVTLKFDRWLWKTIGHIYAASSLMGHFIAISEFKLELKSVNTHFGSKSMIFCPVWPWNLTDDLENQ